MKCLTFSDDMMRALAASEKTMTRRREKRAVPPEAFREKRSGKAISSPDPAWLKPRLEVGDLAAATCSWRDVDDWIEYSFNSPNRDQKWKTPRFMFADDAPFVLRITGVRAERLGAITDSDAIHEGMMHWFQRTHLCPDTTPRDCFVAYWNLLYGNGAFKRDAGSWVWVYRFEIDERRIG